MTTSPPIVSPNFLWISFQPPTESNPSGYRIELNANHVAPGSPSRTIHELSKENAANLDAIFSELCGQLSVGTYIKKIAQRGREPRPKTEPTLPADAPTFSLEDLGL